MFDAEIFLSVAGGMLTATFIAFLFRMMLAYWANRKRRQILEEHLAQIDAIFEKGLEGPMYQDATDIDPTQARLFNIMSKNKTGMDA